MMTQEFTAMNPAKMSSRSRMLRQLVIELGRRDLLTADGRLRSGWKHSVRIDGAGSCNDDVFVILSPCSDEQLADACRRYCS